MKLKLEQYPLLLNALPILDKLHSAGYEAYFVGGAVRDAILGLTIKDVDIATNAYPEQTMSIFDKAIPTGLQHGTVTVIDNKEHYEITTFRHESSYVDYRRPSNVEFVNELKLDLARRDFTMNAMALDINGTLYDPFNGLDALQNHTLVAVGKADERFKEDALRMLRAVRFMVCYRLKPQKDLWDAIINHAPLLQHIAMERVYAELNKMLQAISELSELKQLAESSLLKFTKQSLYIGSNFSRLNTHIAFSQALVANAKWALWLAHSDLSIDEIRSDLNSLKMSTMDKNIILLWIRLTRQCANDKDNEALLKQEWLNALLHHDVQPLEYWLLHISPYINDEMSIALNSFHKQLCIYQIKQLAIKGSELAKSLNRPAGPWLKTTINQLFIAVNLNKLTNKKEDLIEYAANMLGKEDIDEGKA